jgi:type I restriction enzyme, S subunit
MTTMTKQVPLNRSHLGVLPNGWELRPLKSFTSKIGSGATPRGGNSVYLPQRVSHALIRSQNVFDRHFDDENLAFISEDHAVQLRNTSVQKGDVLLNITGDGVTFGRACIVPSRILPACVNQHVSILRVDPCQADPGFLLSFLTHPQTKVYMESFNTGGSRRAITKGHIESFEVPLPPLRTQRKIAGILSGYDDLIENNLRRIKILEKMAQSLYREWFVHFRFPGHESAEFVGSDLGQIPDGWDVKTIEELVKRIPVGKKYDQKSANPSGTVPIFDQGKTGVIGYHDEQPGVDASETDPVIVFANHTCYQRLVHYPFSAIQNVLPFVPDPSLSRNIYWLHYATNGRLVLNDYKGHWPEFAALPVMVPPSGVCQRFGAFVAPLSIEMLKLERAVKILRQTRDLLLPKLLQGGP